MSSSIISVNGLSKKFIISHEEQEKYTTLRDVVAKRAKKVFSTSGPKVVKEEFWALKDVNFKIDEGERVGIIGRNGAGKSTLLKILSRITEPTNGVVRIKGRIASLLEVGTGFHPELTGRENIFLNGAILGMRRSEIKSKFDEIVAFSEVERFLDTPVKRYSSGMYVKLAFAVAAHLEPEILIIDEVLAVGDAQFQKKCLTKMEDVSTNDGRTLLFVSHNMGVIAQICQRVIFLSKGQVVEDGPTRHAIDRYILNAQSASENIYIAKGSDEKQIYFQRISTENSAGQSTSDFQFDESVCLRIEIVVNKIDINSKVSVTFQNSNGEFLSTILEDLSQYYVDGVPKIILKVKFAPEVLTPISYAFRCAIFHPNHEVYDLVEMVCPIRIIDTGSKMAQFEGINYGSFFIKYDVSQL